MLDGLLWKRLLTVAALMVACFAVSAEAGSDLSVEEIAPRIKQVSFKSSVLGVEKRFCVVLPDGYEADRGDWPWLLLLHGRGRHERSLVDDPRARAALLAAPFVVVLPDGDQSWYVDSPLGRYETYLEEVLRVASARFGLSGNPSRRAITGWSMGGYGCVRFVQTQNAPKTLGKGATAGLSSSEDSKSRESTAGQASSGTRITTSRISQQAAKGDWKFALVAPIIGLLDYPSDPQGFPAGQSYAVRTEVFGKDSSGWEKFNPIRQAQGLRGTSILLITADRAFDRTMNARFSRRLGELGIEHELKVLEGTHSLDVVREALPLVIERTEQVFKTPVYKTPIELKLVDVKKIWDRGPHNAFTDMIRFDDKWYVAFREADSHSVPAVGRPGGKVRVIRSEDGRDWTSVALLDYGPNQDVRDAKLSITPDDRLMLLAAAAPHAKRNSRQSLVWFSDDGLKWAGPHEVGEKDWWLWRVTWAPDGMAYGVAYGDITSHPRTTRLYRSRDGVDFQTIVKTLTPEPATGETGLIFRRDGSAVALVRQDGKQRDGKVGVARGDFTNWKFRNLGLRVGGPTLIELPSGHIVAATRLYDGGARTSLSLLDPEEGKLTELLTLPSGGDTSYPGLVWHDNMLWVSYYSSHEGKTSIYLAKVRVLPAEKR